MIHPFVTRSGWPVEAADPLGDIRLQLILAAVRRCSPLSALLCLACASTSSQLVPGAACSGTLVAIHDSREPVGPQLLEAHFEQGARHHDREQVRIVRVAERPEIRNRSNVARIMEKNYPPELRNVGIGGDALLQLLIDEEGRVLSSVVYRSSGNARLDQASVAISKSIEFRPVSVAGCRAAYLAEIPIAWRSSSRPQ